MLFRIKSYLKFLCRSTNQHGIHSPFVYDLVTKCFYDRRRYPEYDDLDRYRNTLLQNKRVISVTDFGAGSKVFKSNWRRVDEIAKNAGISPNRARLLFRLSRYFACNTVLEIGTSVGLATAALALANRESNVTSLEGCAATAEIAVSALKDISGNVDVVVTEFSAYMASATTSDKKYDMIYFDGNHSKEATLKYFNHLLSTVHNETVWIFDDIHWSQGMEEAWNEIEKHPKVSVSIDTYQWGIVFFRAEQQKEDFTVRI